MKSREGMRGLSLRRMDELCTYYSGEAGVEAILAFGSLGNLEQFDDCSDLDFLIVCHPEQKVELIGGVPSLSAVFPVAYWSIEFTDAVKLLFCDGVLCDYGIVTEEQLVWIYHGEGRILWERSDFPEKYTLRNLPPDDTEVVMDPVGEILMRLYVGILRERRGEKAAAFEEIQILAVDKLLKLLSANSRGADPFSPLRRAEKLVVGKEVLSKLMPGYGRSIEAAKAVLGFVETSERHEGLLDQIRVLL